MKLKNCASIDTTPVTVLETKKFNLFPNKNNFLFLSIDYK